MIFEFRKSVSKWLLALAIVAFATAAWAGQWTVLGPDGGDVRSFAYDPHNPDRIYLGTSTGTLFVSEDRGEKWMRFAHLGSGDDLVVDHIAIDPTNSQTMYAAVWSVENQQVGDIFRTRDGGKTWETLPGMHNKSVRAMALAPSDHAVMVAGALDGVFRSSDGGNTWERLSPANHAEIKNIESVAVDPKDPNVVYAGTWHLAWKTPDGGKTWQHINKGMIDDSDVFSIIVDSKDPSVVFASACSGIYRSDTAGEAFRKLQGIPFSARRTRVLRQDPSNQNTVYAGTTEGLWKTMDGGKTWKRVSNPNLVVNDVMVDPRNSSRLLLATDRSGVLASNDGAQSFETSNKGYVHRYVTAMVSDNQDPAVLWVGVVNDREWGGVFYSRDAGQHWMQKNSGLDGRDVFALKQAPNGELVAGTQKGIFVLAANSSEWRPANTVVVEKPTTKLVRKNGKTTKVEAKTITKSTLEARVNDIELSDKRWLAATSSGMYTSTDHGKTWMGGPVMGQKDFIAVQSQHETMVLATRGEVMYSNDNGNTWQQGTIASYPVNIKGLAFTPDGQMLMATREGGFRSSNGAQWEHMLNGLPDKTITSIMWDGASSRLLATSLATGVVFESRDNGASWHRGPDSGYPLKMVKVVGGRFVAATPFDGVIVQPAGEAQSADAAMGGASN
jgi:photosystem II stability/assembly factor-like uncharacterized protein